MTTRAQMREQPSNAMNEDLRDAINSASKHVTTPTTATMVHPPDSIPPTPLIIAVQTREEKKLELTKARAEWAVQTARELLAAGTVALEPPPAAVATLAAELLRQVT